MAGIELYQSSRKPYAGKPEPVVIGIPTMMDSSALVFIADEKGYFAENGLDVTIHEYEAGLYAVDDMLKGKNDIAVATEFVMVGKIFDQEEIGSIASIAKYESHYLIGRKDRGIEDVSDLKGKRIGYARGTSGEFYLNRYLELHGMNLSEITPVDVRPSQYAEAIENGSVDAILSWEPYAGITRDHLGEDVVAWPAQSGQLGYWNAICKKDWAEAHPETVYRFLKAIDRAVEYTIYHPDEAKAISQRRLNASETYVEDSWNNTQYSLSLDQSLITAMEDEGRWMIASNLTGERNIPDYQNYTYLTAIGAVKPESVNIIV
ncbi:ABC transporter substrate-binding protein [Methanocella sp. MCL-LM]|uniref:ABC transporter substrate-binding protein n=1 Tax=Methanocella sp. MCL-LM TaxID=3412035 RepID=UPI003C71194C